MKLVSATFLDELNSFSSGRGIVVQCGKQIQSNLFCWGDLCHVLPLCDVGSIIEATLWNGLDNA